MTLGGGDAQASEGACLEAQFVDRSHAMFDNPAANIWSLRHINYKHHDPYFYLEKPFGEKRPRLVACSRLGQFASGNYKQSQTLKKLIVTTSDKNGY